MNVEPVRSSETSVNFYQTARRHMPENSTLNSGAVSPRSDYRSLLCERRKGAGRQIKYTSEKQNFLFIKLISFISSNDLPDYTASHPSR
jgi:hypothetical protein